MHDETDLTKTLYLDRKMRVIAAGPVLIVNDKLLGPYRARAVIMEDERYGGYVVGYQTLDDLDQHRSLDHSLPAANLELANRFFIISLGNLAMLGVAPGPSPLPDTRYRVGT